MYVMNYKAWSCTKYFLFRAVIYFTLETSLLGVSEYRRLCLSFSIVFVYHCNIK